MEPHHLGEMASLLRRLDIYGTRSGWDPDENNFDNRSSCQTSLKPLGILNEAKSVSLCLSSATNRGRKTRTGRSPVEKTLGNSYWQLLGRPSCRSEVTVSHAFENEGIRITRRQLLGSERSLRLGIGKTSALQMVRKARKTEGQKRQCKGRANSGAHVLRTSLTL